MSNSQVVGAYQPFSASFSKPIYSPDSPPTQNRGENYPIGQVWIKQFSNPASNTVSFLTNIDANYTWTSFSSSGFSPIADLVITNSLTLQYANGENGVLITNNSGLVSAVSAAVNMPTRQLLMSQGVGTAPSFQSLVAGAGVTINNSGNSLSIAVAGGGFTWTAENSSFPAAVNNGYVIADGSAGVTATLPAAAALGDTINILYNSESAGDILTVDPGAGTIVVPGMDSAGSGAKLVMDECISGNQYQALMLVCSDSSGPVWQLAFVSGSIHSLS